MGKPPRGRVQRIEGWKAGGNVTPAARPLTELENCVLGLVWERGPCTPYALRKEFLDSPAPYWSGSAGAIYPLIARLERRGLIRSHATATGRRKGKGLTLTPKGLSHLCAWLCPPLAAEVVGLPPDPLRVRLRFLTALPRKQQAAFLAAAEKQVREQLERVEQAFDREAAAGFYAHATARGALAHQRARLEWIRETAEALTGSRDGSRHNPPVPKSKATGG